MTIRTAGRALLAAHCFELLVWMAVNRASVQPPSWMLYVFALTLFTVQFSWGFTVGLIIGPKRMRRPLLWAGLATLPVPLYYVGYALRLLGMAGLPGPFMIVWIVATVILTAETYSGVMLGCATHFKLRNGDEG